MLSKLSDLAIIIMGQSPSSNCYNSINVGLPFLQGRTTFGRIFPTFDTWTTCWNKEAAKGDILLTVRAPVGDINIAPTELAIGRGIAAIRATSCHPIYLFYLLEANKTFFTNNSTGTIFDSIKYNDISNMVFNVHSYAEQLYIVDTIHH